MSVLTQLGKAAFASVKDATSVCRSLFRIMIPLIVGMKILSELDLIKYLAMPLEPLMALMGLPADFGIIWAAGMAVNLYSSFIVLATLLPAMEPLTTAQVSTFGLVLLYAHSLPIEGRIAQQCGVSFLGQVSLRIAVALAAGIGLHAFCARTGWLSGPADILFLSGNPHPTWGEWARGEATNLVYIFLIISVLLFVQRGIDHFKLSRWLEIGLEPLLSLVGVSRKAATTIMIGMSMGIIYGSGLIIRASRDGSLSKKDIFGTVTLMGLAHAIVEDTLLLMVIGSNWIVVLVIRSLIAIGVGALVMRMRDRFNPIVEPA